MNKTLNQAAKPKASETFRHRYHLHTTLTNISEFVLPNQGALIQCLRDRRGPLVADAAARRELCSDATPLRRATERKRVPEASPRSEGTEAGREKAELRRV